MLRRKRPSEVDAGSDRPEPSFIAAFGPPILVGLLVVGVATLLLANVNSSPDLPGHARTRKAAAFDGQEVSPRLPAPTLGRLRNYLGEPVSLSSYRGDAVLVTFLYTHCPDVCPLIAGQLRTTLEEVTPSVRRRTRIVAVSVDPTGDTTATVASFLKVHGMVGRMKYLIGSRGELAPVWKAWKVSASSEPTAPEFVAHSALVYGIDGAGDVTTVYPANFEPGELAHDLPRLIDQ